MISSQLCLYPHQGCKQKAMVISTYPAVDRGGDWKFNCFVKILNMMWREWKNTSAYCMPQVAGDNFSFDASSFMFMCSMEWIPMDLLELELESRSEREKR